MTTQSRLQEQIDFEREMAEYYEEIGLDRLAARARDIAAEKASVAAELADPAALYARAPNRLRARCVRPGRPDRT